jgi:hypothetical protein
LRHVILTTNSALADLTPQEFKRLKKLVGKTFDDLLGKQWYKHGQGYIMGTEFGETGLKLHFHVLFYGEWIDKLKLSELWEKRTGNSVTYVREVTPEEGVQEVVKYVTKFGALNPYRVPKLAEVIAKSRRFISRGIFYNLPTPDEKPMTCPVCQGALIKWENWQFENYQREAAARLARGLGNAAGTLVSVLAHPPPEQLELLLDM